jgi:DNA-binding MarR family transcriptional regulator
MAASPEQSGDAVRLWQAINTAHATFEARLDAEPATCEMLGSDTVAILLPLAEARDGFLAMHDLARRAHLTPSGLTRRVDRLAEHGWVTRRGCPRDRRVAYAVLTDAGRAELARALPHHAAALERWLRSRLDGTQMRLLLELLDRLAVTNDADVSRREAA